MFTLETLLELAGPSVGAVLDVGAFAGEFSLAAAAAHPRLRFIAIEPVPARAAALREQAGPLATYLVLEAAIGMPDGSQATLRLPGSAEQSNFSSLLPLRADRRDWREVALERSLRVGVRSLESVLAQLAPELDVVAKIDTQGYDLQALDSLGESARRLRAGVLETFVRSRHVIYEGAPTRAQTVRALWRRGFEVVGVESEHASNHDQNLLFAGRDLFRCWPLQRARYPLLLARAWARHALYRARIRARALPQRPSFRTPPSSKPR